MFALAPAVRIEAVMEIAVIATIESMTIAADAAMAGLRRPQRQARWK
jgi:hypothetical protein